MLVGLGLVRVVRRSKAAFDELDSAHKLDDVEALWGGGGGDKRLVWDVTIHGLFGRTSKVGLRMRWIANPSQCCSHFPHRFWSLYVYLVHC